MFTSMRKRELGLMDIWFVSMAAVSAQVEKKSELFQLLKEMDQKMYAIGINQCNLEQVEKLTHDDFEFYHDKDGVTNSKKAFLKVVKTDLCSTGKNVITRVLDESSLDIFPMYDKDGIYAAMQTGIHSFGSASARFMHLWLLENEEWKLSRVMSYDHQIKKVAHNQEGDFMTLSIKDLVFYLGNYQFSPDFTLSIVNEGGKLYGDSQGEKVEIKAYDKHKFVAADNSVKIHFQVDDKGKVAGLTMVTPEGAMMAKKVKQ